MYKIIYGCVPFIFTNFCSIYRIYMFVFNMIVYAKIIMTLYEYYNSHFILF